MHWVSEWWVTGDIHPDGRVQLITRGGLILPLLLSKNEFAMHYTAQSYKTYSYEHIIYQKKRG